MAWEAALPSAGAAARDSLVFVKHRDVTKPQWGGEKALRHSLQPPGGSAQNFSSFAAGVDIGRLLTVDQTADSILFSYKSPLFFCTA